MGKSGERGRKKDHRSMSNKPLEGDQMREALARAGLEVPKNSETSESNSSQEIAEKVKNAADLAIAEIENKASNALDLNDPSLSDAEKKRLAETQQKINEVRDQAVAEIEAALNEAGITEEKIKSIKEVAHKKILATAKSGEMQATATSDLAGAEGVKTENTENKPITEASGEVFAKQAPIENEPKNPETVLEGVQKKALELVEERKKLFEKLKEDGVLEKNPQLKKMFDESRERLKDYNTEGGKPTLERDQEIINYLEELLQKIKTQLSGLELNPGENTEAGSGETKESELDIKQRAARLFESIRSYTSNWKIGEPTSFKTEKDKKRGLAIIEKFGNQITELLSKKDRPSIEERGQLIEAMALLSEKIGQWQDRKNKDHYLDPEDVKQMLEDGKNVFVAVAEKMFPEVKTPRNRSEALRLIRAFKNNRFGINEENHQEAFDRMAEVLDDIEKLKKEIGLEITYLGKTLGWVVNGETVTAGRELLPNDKDLPKKVIRDERYIYQLKLILDALDIEGTSPQEKKEAKRELSPEDKLKELHEELENEISREQLSPEDRLKDLHRDLSEEIDSETASEENQPQKKSREASEKKESYQEKVTRLNNLILTCRTSLTKSTLTNFRKQVFEGMISDIADKLRRKGRNISTKELDAYIKDLQDYKIIIERGDTTPDNLPIQNETDMKNKTEGGRQAETRPNPESGKSPEKREGEPGIVVEIDFARHSLKGKLGDREVITPAGMVAAAAKGREDRGNYSRIIKKVNEGKILEIFGSPRERTTQSSLLRMLGEQFKDVNFDNVDPQEIVDWINSGDLLKVQESPLLDFILEKKGKYFDGAMKAFKEGRLLEWYVKESDQVALEAKADSEVSTLSTQAGNVAAFIWSFGANKTKEMAEKGEKSDFAFATSHQGVLECFLYKVILAQEGKVAADKFVESKKAAFAENEGFKVKFRRFGEGPEDFDVSVKYEGKNYVVSSKELFRIMNEGFMLKQQLWEINKKEQQRIEEEKIAKEEEQRKKERQEKADYREFAHRKGILDGFFLTRFIGRKTELLKNRLDRFTGKGDSAEGRYDIINRGIVKLANLFDSKFFNYRDAKSEKIESKIATIDGEIEFLKNEIDEAESIVSDQDLPYKERSKAQARMNANKKKLRLLEQKREDSYEALHIVEQKKKECHDRISERCQGVAEAIKERVEPYKDKIEDGKRVLEKINLEISEGEAKKKEWENKLLELENKYANSPRFQRGKIKKALKDAKKAIKRVDYLIKESTKKAEICRDKLSHLRDILNPWDNLRAAYEDAGQLPEQQENEELKEYEKTSFEATSDSWEMASNETRVAAGSYVKKFNSWLKIKYGRSQEELTVEKLQEALGDNNNPSLKEIEDAVTTIYENQMSEQQIQRMFNNVRVDIK